MDPQKRLYLGLSPCPVTVTDRIVIFLVGDPYKPSFATVTGRGDNPSYTVDGSEIRRSPPGMYKTL